MKLRENIINMELIIDEYFMPEGSFRVFGESEKLKILRKYLDDNGYNDDTLVANRFFSYE